MLAPLRQLWKPIASSETVEGGVETAKAVFELAKTLNEGQSKDTHIKQLVAKIPTLLEALNSPIGELVKSSLPFVSLTTKLIEFTIEVTKREPTFSENVAIVVQLAYLESVKVTLSMKPGLVNDESIASGKVVEQIRKLGEIEIKIDDEESKSILASFKESKLAQEFNKVLSERLKGTTIPELEIDILVKKVSFNTQRYIDKVLVEAGDRVKELKDWYSVGAQDKFEKYLSIDTYLKENIQPLPIEKVFGEEFSFEQIYVPLKAISLDANGQKISGAEDFCLHQWVQEYILKPEKQDKVIFIEAGPGRGKTVFCRMFADWVRQELYPILMPIFIRLRDVEAFGANFDKTISDALSYCDFVTTDNGWLTDSNTQYLFLLDGFDELHIEGRASGSIDRLIEQVGRFQSNFKGKKTGHRVILTGRSLALQGINYLPENLERVEILPMDDRLQSQWLEKWQEVVMPNNPIAAKEETGKFKDFLRADSCPREIKDELAREPLLLYLLAKLHKNGKIKEEDFRQSQNSTQAKILIYQKSLEWVLEEQRPKPDQYKITGLNTESLERILIAKKTSNYTQVMQELSGSNWKLNQWDNSAFNNEVSIDSVTIEFTKNQISGFGGCNRFSGTYNRQGDKLTISDLNYTMRGCETSIMRREESFLGAMAGIKKVRFLENQLLLEYKTNRGESGVLEFSKTNSPNLSVNTPNGNIFPHPSPGDDNLPLGNPGVSQ
jgi:heat shock protein HslJ